MWSHILSLVIVDVASIDHVAGVDEELGSPHGLDKVTRSLHFSHELDEELSSTVRIHTLHQAVDGPNQAVWVRETVVVLYGRVNARIGIRGDVGRNRGTTGGAKNRNGIVGRAVCDDTHRDEHDEQVHPDGRVREPAVFGESSHLTNEETNDGPDQTANGVAKLELRYLGNGLSITDHDQADTADQLDTLQDVDHVARACAVETECQVSVILQREFVRVQPQEDFPQQVSRTTVGVSAIDENPDAGHLLSSHETEDSEKRDTWAPSERSDGETTQSVWRQKSRGRRSHTQRRRDRGYRW